ncbi:MAG: DUF5665 domain-containing protein [Proteobacteria bacterium]|nr:DUF5665 domain-containing protein [Pseudomonadota bacterium]
MGTEHHNDIHRPRRKMLLDNFLGGVAWGLGSVMGGTLVLTVVIIVVGYLLGKIEFVPIIGEWVQAISQEVAKHQATRP